MSDTNALIEALRPFAALLDEWESEPALRLGDDIPVYVQPVGGTVQKLHVRDLRRAHDTIKAAEKGSAAS